MNLSPSFWKNKKVLITGHTGFKGSWLSAMLKFLGSEVYGVSNFNVLSDNYKSLKNSTIFEEEFKIDIFQDVDLLDLNINKNNFDVVFHFAAQGLVSEARIDPLLTINSNIIGTFNILEKTNQNESIKTLIIATTDKVYLHSDKENREHDSLGGKEFYSASKASTEHLISAFQNTRKRKNLNIGVIRSGNVLGGGDGAKDRIVTDVIEALKGGNNIILRNPNAIRPWQFILDSLLGYVLCAQYCNIEKKDEVFNLNSKYNNEYSVLNLVNAIINHWGPNNSKIKFINSEFYETEILKINSEKAEKILNWTAKVDIDFIARFIVDWEKENQKGKNITLDQIENYFNLN